MVSSSRGLSRPRSFGLDLPQTRTYSYKSTETLSAVCCSRERLLRMLCFQLYPRASRPRDTRCSGGKITCSTREPEISSKLYLIIRWNISFKPLDWSLTNFSSRFPHKFRNSPALILSEMLIWNEKDRVKYGDFPDQFCSLEPLLQITRGTKTIYVIIGPVWPSTKPWTIYTSSLRLM